MSENDSRTTEPTSTPCPICKQPSDPDSDSHPFCSPRCRQIDLGRWLDGRYVISRPIEQTDLDED